MLSKLQEPSDKLKLFFHNGTPFNLFFRRQFSMSKQTHKIQALYDFCKLSFTPNGPYPPSSQVVHKLCSLLDTIAPADVGLKEENTDDDRGFGFFGNKRMGAVARWAQPLTYIDIHECESFTMCIFCFPTSAVIPLHDHPGMTVFSKVLYGSLHVKAYDWVEPACTGNSKRPGQSPVRLAKLAVDKVLTPSRTSVLYPKSGGNLHCFTAVSPCAILDILTPPYREDAGRKCSYYQDYPYSSFSDENEVDGEKENYSWLEEIETPDDLYMRPGRYTGPAVQL